MTISWHFVYSDQLIHKSHSTEIISWPSLALLWYPYLPTLDWISSTPSSAHHHVPSTTSCLYGLGAQCWGQVMSTCDARVIHQNKSFSMHNAPYAIASTVHNMGGHETNCVIFGHSSLLAGPPHWRNPCFQRSNSGHTQSQKQPSPSLKVTTPTHCTHQKEKSSDKFVLCKWMPPQNYQRDFSNEINSLTSQILTHLMPLKRSFLLKEQIDLKSCI